MGKTLDWKEFFKDKKVTVMGLGLLGRGVGDAAFIAQYAEEVIVTDLKSAKDLKPSLDKLKRFKNIKYTLGRHEAKDFEDRDFILKAAGVPLDSMYVKHAKEHGVPVFMSTALFAKLSPATIVGITGTRGKSTVTQMLYEILKKSWGLNRSKKGMVGRTTRLRVVLGGNVQGVSTLALLPKTKKGDIAVLELDSWQLQGFIDLRMSPNLAVFTTFMPDHLNYYKNDLELYFHDKLGIFAYQTDQDIALAGETLCSLPRAFTSEIPRHVRFVSDRALPKNTRLLVLGEHNRFNAALAFEAARALRIPSALIQKSLQKFKGVDGRLQKIAVHHGVEIYNDTTATTPHALAAALESLGQTKRIILIAGGTDKRIDLGVLREPLKTYCKHLLLLKGTGTDRLIQEKIIPKTIEYKVYSSLKDAVKAAKKIGVSGDTILLSPGFASFGMFKNEYDRGDQFNALIKKLKK